MLLCLSKSVCREIPSVIQKSLDRESKDLDCIFVICGSSTTVMLKETQDEKILIRYTNVLHIIRKIDNNIVRFEK